MNQPPRIYKPEDGELYHAAVRLNRGIALALLPYRDTPGVKRHYEIMARIQREWQEWEEAQAAQEATDVGK